MSKHQGVQLKLKVGNTWFKYDYIGGEAEAEAISSILLNHMNNHIPHVNYWCVGKGICASRNFLEGGWEEVTFQSMLDMENANSEYHSLPMDCKFEYVVDVLKAYGILKKVSRPYLETMGYIDYLLFNEDRHEGNFGVLKRGKEVIPMPLFDFGQALGVGSESWRNAENFWETSRSKEFSIVRVENHLNAGGRIPLKINPRVLGILDSGIPMPLSDRAYHYAFNAIKTSPGI